MRSETKPVPKSAWSLELVFVLEQLALPEPSLHPYLFLYHKLQPVVAIYQRKFRFMVGLPPGFGRPGEGDGDGDG